MQITSFLRGILKKHFVFIFSISAAILIGGVLLRLDQHGWIEYEFETTEISEIEQTRDLNGEIHRIESYESSEDVDSQTGSLNVIDEQALAQAEVSPDSEAIKEISIHQIEDEGYQDPIDESIPPEPVTIPTQHSLSTTLAYTAPNNPKLSKEVMGFATYWRLDGYYQYFQYDKLSTISYFSTNVDGNGNFINDTPWSRWRSAAMTDMINRAHSHGVKVVPVVKNFYAPDIYKIVRNVGSARTRLINNVKAEIAYRGADGVNIDFEYVSGGSGCDGTCTVDKVRPYFPIFMDQLADSLGHEYHVSIDVYAGSASWYGAYDIAALGATSIDYIMVMDYDIYRTNSSFAAPTAPLYSSGQYYFTVSQSINDMISKAPRGKILMGIPYYGLEFPTFSSAYNASTRSTGAIAYYASIVDPSEDTWHNPSTIRWNNNDKVRWYAYRYPDPNTSEWWGGYYDDPSSIGAKYDFAKSKQIGGVAIWALAYDHGYSDLYNVIRDKFSKDDVIVVFKDGYDRNHQQAVHNALGATVVRYLADESSVIVSPNSGISYDLIRRYRARSDVAGADFEAVRELPVVQ